MPWLGVGTTESRPSPPNHVAPDTRSGLRVVRFEWGSLARNSGEGRYALPFCTT